MALPAFGVSFSLEDIRNAIRNSAINRNDCSSHHICPCMSDRLHMLEHKVYAQANNLIDLKERFAKIAETFESWSGTGSNWQHSKNVANQIARRIREEK